LEYIADKDLLDNLSRELFEHPQMRKEDLSLAVLNATGYRNLGRTAARLAGNMGVEVVAIADYEKNLSDSSLVVLSSQLKSSFTAGKLAKLYGIAEIKVGELAKDYRADMVLIVGRDYYRRITGF
jgi:DNA-binding MurR/RpiR family transcriptional regulator